MTRYNRFLRWILRKIYYKNFDIRYTFDDNFDPKRTDPYFLIGNHSSLRDGQYTFLPLEMYCYPVINIFEYTSPLMDFVLTKVIRTIPKRKGQSDIQTIRMIMDAMKQGHGVLLYPEGNSSYFGMQSEVPFSTAKLIKKSKYDVVFCKVNGGYLSAPRWSDKAVKGGRFEVHYYTLFKASELPSLTVEEVYHKIIDAIAFNDFEWNRIAKARYVSKHRADGLQRFLYWCPICGAAQTLTTKGHSIHCTHCGEIATFDEYSFLQGEGFPYDNLIPWGNDQMKIIPDLIKGTIATRGSVNISNLATHRNRHLGEYQIRLEEGVLRFIKDKKHFDLKVEQIKGLVLTKRDGLSFDYEDKVYYMHVSDPMLFLNAIDYLNGGLESWKNGTSSSTSS